MILKYKKRAFILFACVLFSSILTAQSRGFEVIKNLELMDLIHLNLEKFYVDEPKTGEISKVAIDAMLKELDPYTVFYHETNIEDYRMMTTGQYGGIGALIRKYEDYVVIAEPYQDNPAAEAGLRAGDKILEIDGRDMKNKSTEEVSNALKGIKGSKVEVKIERPFGEVKTFQVERNEIKLPDVPYHGLLNDNVGYIKLNSFTKTASKSVYDAFKDLQSQGMEELILDLRGNGGGLLMESVNIVNFFVPQGEKVVETKGRIPEENRVYKTQNKPLDLDIPLVVLIDEGSASASEIVSGALQDLDRAVVVGRNSFGKGLVQRTVDLKYGAKMKLTISRYHTPSGRCVQKLDYYHKNEDKSVSEVPDSLITIFKTRNGREVIDSRGVDPDIEIESERMGRLTATLLAKNIIFDYATKYAHNNPEIASPEDFKLTESDLKDFKNFLLEKDFEYTSRSEEKLEDVFRTAELEGYDELIGSEYEALMKKVKGSKEKDIEIYEDQILELLQNEIVSRYHFQKGRIVNAFNTDDAITEAIKILKDPKAYKKILGF